MRVGDTIAVDVEVMEIREEKKHVRLKTICLNHHGEKSWMGRQWLVHQDPLEK